MLKVVNLTKIYKPKSGKPVRALDGVNLEIADTGLVFLLGKSGSGKSTLLNLLGGLDTYTDGDIIIKGKSTKDFDQSNFDSYRNTFIGFIFQEFNILEEYSVGRNIAMALELQHKKGDRAAVEELLAQVDMEGFYDRKPNELSGGQKQRIAIARALIKKPEIIMADEPTGALDSRTGKQVFDVLKKIGETKLVIVVTHDRDNAEIYGDRIIELADGKVISDRVRSSETGGALSEQNVTVVDDKLVRIKAGTKLTADDVKKINGMLEKANEDVYLSLDSAANAGFDEKAARTVGRGRTKFVATTPDKVNAKTYDPSKFKLVKSRLPFKDSFRMGVSGMKHKKVRLVFTILLSFIAFALAGFSTAASLFDRTESEYETMMMSSARNLFVQSVAGQDGSIGNPYFSEYNSKGITPEQIKRITELTGYKPLTMINDVGYASAIDFASQLPNLPRDENRRSLYYATEIWHLVEVPSEQAAALTPIGVSRLPTAAYEIAISDYIAESFIEYGYSDDSGKEVKIAEPIDMLGKKLYYEYKNNRKPLTIVGVYETAIDKSKYERYKTTAYSGLRSMTFDTSYLMMGMGYVMPGFGDGLEEEADSSIDKDGTYRLSNSWYS